jgi:RNA polymerase sigma-54 factor
MIEKEDVAKPLSDQMVSNILKVQGIHAARRTVAKYREELGMLSSNKRKRKW